MPDQPIAIVGIGCRFPGGVRDPQSYWAFLSRGQDAITDIPAERWQVEDYFDASGSAPGKCAARKGGFLGAVDGFDAGFFHIGAREAAHMDPQHRLLMEVAWEAIERAGIPAGRLAGSHTGVYVGIYTDDYRLLHLPSKRSIDAYSGTGTIHTMAANRISYYLDLKGPSMAVDATCASSLVAIHLASESLWRGECELAIAGAVNLILSPLSMLSAAKVVAMAADGRCKAFDARADGIVRGEGCGVLVLKRMNDALANGDAIWALIEGTAVNQDGRSNGMTAPNPAAQEDVIRRALQRAGVGADRVQYVEAHGTGTSLGDPIEIEALSRVFPPGLKIGSVKTNFGHLEAAAGMAGLIKTVLALKYGSIPPHLHLRQLNPALVEFAGGFEIPTALCDWPGSVEHRRAGVSAFSLGGTNAHVVLAGPPPAAESVPDIEPRLPFLLPVSAESAEALKQRSREYAECLASLAPEISIRDVGYTAAIRRTHHRFRSAVVASSLPEAAANLRERAEPNLGPRGGSAGAVFVFTGQGARWSRTGIELLKTSAVFRASVQSSDEILRSRAHWSLISDLEKGGGARSVAVSQAAILALQLGLVDLLGSLGVRPAAVIGHSLGEAAAACAAGVLCREDAIEMLLQRGALSQQVAGRGKMAAVGLPEEEAAEIIERHSGRISLAAVNSDCSVVLSGEPQEIDAVSDEARQRGFTFVPLSAECAFHSAQMMPLIPRLVRTTRRFAHRVPSDVMYSTVSGRRIEGGEIGPVHWGRNLAEPVRFADAVTAAIGDGYSDYLEIGPAAVLSPHIRRLLDANGARGSVCPLLQSGKPEWESVLRALGHLYENGQDLQWDSLYPIAHPIVPLPLYPWQRRRYWLEDEISESPSAMERAAADWAWHHVGGERIFSAAGFLDAAGAVLKENGRGGVEFEGVEIHTRLSSPEKSNTVLGTSIHPRADGACEFTIASAQSARHATGIVRPLPSAAPDSVAALPKPDGQLIIERDGIDGAALLDRCLREAARSYVGSHGPALVAGIDRAIVRSSYGRQIRVRWVIRHTAGRAGAIDIDALDEDGRWAAKVRGIRLQHPAQQSVLQDWTYEVVWQPHEVWGSSAREGLSVYERAGKRIGEYCAELAAEILRKRPGRIEHRYSVLIERMMEIAARACGADGGSRAIRQDLHREFPELDPEMDLLARCGEALPAVLEGGANPLEVIFAPGSKGLGPADRVYRESPFARYWNDVAKSAVLESIDRAGQGSKIRILEVGGGTGGVTASLLPHLRDRHVEYYFTDVGAWFVSRARAEFTKYSFLKYARLDISQDGDAQGFAETDFDVILAANCIHAVADVTGCLKRLKGLARPGGSLLLLEGTSNVEWADLTFGTTEGWFHNGARNSPRDADQWMKVLAEAEWEDARAVARHGGAAMLVARRASSSKRLWIVLGNPMGFASKIGSALRASGEEARIVELALIESLTQDDPAGVVDCRYVDSGPECTRAVEMVVEVAQCLAALGWRTPPRLWLVTCGMHAPGTAEQLAQSSLNGAARVLFTEHPEFAGGTIDVGVLDQPERTAEQIRRIVSHRGVEDTWWIRGGTVSVPRLKRRQAAHSGVAIRERGTYLITGGTGGMGLHQAQWLARQGARHIVLVGRRKRPEIGSRLREIEALGAEVSVRTADVADKVELSGIIDEIAASGFSLRGVIHSAGVIHDAVIGNLTPEDLRRVIRPKVVGAWNLHTLTEDLQLDFFLLCSSAATLIGLIGLCGYAAANAFLDGLAAYRRAAGLAAHAIDWGGWSGTGMAERVGGERNHQWTAHGLHTMPPEHAVEALADAIGGGDTRACIMNIDWEEFRKGYPGGRTPALYECLMAACAAGEPGGTAVQAVSTLREEMEQAAVSDRPAVFFAFLRDQLSKLLVEGLPRNLDPTQSILDLGVDSLMAVEVRNSLAGALGVTLPVTSLFDYPTPELLLCHAARLAGMELPEWLRHTVAV